MFEKLRNASSVFVVYGAHQSTTCSPVKNDKSGWMMGGSERRDEREGSENRKHK